MQMAIQFIKLSNSAIRKLLTLT